MIYIHPMNLAALDLNLLVALDALLREANVSRAAMRIGLSQPAASHALQRLREVLGDPLLVRVGARMELTLRAQACAGRWRRRSTRCADCSFPTISMRPAASGSFA
jgi:DNA-binding transcriptional LysR family regulator